MVSVLTFRFRAASCVILSSLKGHWRSLNGDWNATEIHLYVLIQSPFSHHSVTIQSTERWDFILWMENSEQKNYKNNLFKVSNERNTFGVLLTAVWTIVIRSSLICFTNSKTLIRPDSRPFFNKESKPMNVPVRPTPAL